MYIYINAYVINIFIKITIKNYDFLKANFFFSTVSLNTHKKKSIQNKGTKYYERAMQYLEKIKKKYMGHAILKF